MKLRYGLWPLALACACASMSESDCRGANWYERGWQDALAGNRSRIDVYVEHCKRFGAVPDAKQYAAGWGAGYNEWNARVSHGRM